MHVHELGPHFRAKRLAFQAADGAAGELALDVGEGLNILFQVGAHHALHGVAIETDDLRQHVAGEHRRAAGLFFQDDLQQDAAGQVFVGLGIDHIEFFIIEHQLLDVRQGDVGAGLGIVQTAIGIFFNQAVSIFFRTTHHKSTYCAAAHTLTIRKKSELRSAFPVAYCAYYRGEKAQYA